HQGLTESIRKSLEEAATSEAYDLAGKAWKALEAAQSEGEQRLAELAVASKELVIQREEAKKNLDELVNDLQATSGVLRFDVEGNLSDGAQLLVRYQVREAGWAPVHEIRADPAKGLVEWIYKARIWQRTGEDWSSVTASLNSASALNAAGLPDLPPWILQRIEPRPYLSSKARGVSDEAYLMQAPSMAMADAEMASPESTTTGFFIHLPQTLSLDSGKEPAVREAFTGQLKADFWSEAVPELSTEAWLMAGMTNELGWPILAGESYCYIDGQLVARRQIQGIAAGEEIELALGRNEKISIERKERVRKESEGGLIDRTKRHDFKFETKVDNRMKVAHRVVLQDRFPVGRDNKIQVRIVAPKDVEPEEGTGLFKWERTLPAGGNVVMTTEYTIIYPAEWILNTPM
ncbi:MAG TPA: DUF4139 domain-containing protein, partial [Oceanipulchritudo sp.]|nr:DUF4139 domain-containing protein [Oceanipulchritudo sp.]